MSFQGFWETNKTLQANGPTLTAAAAATCLNPQAKHTYAGGYWANVGQKLRVEASGRISSLVTTPGTARFDLRFGATVIFDSQAILLDTVAGHVTVGWHLLINLTLQITGSAAQFFGDGLWTSEDLLGTPAGAPKGCLTAILPWNVTPALGTAFDASVAQTLDMFFTQTAATGSMTVHQFEATSTN
jgi:hypothetical protein